MMRCFKNITFTIYQTASIVTLPFIKIFVVVVNLDSRFGFNLSRKSSGLSGFTIVISSVNKNRYLTAYRTEKPVNISITVTKKKETKKFL